MLHGICRKKCNFKKPFANPINFLKKIKYTKNSFNVLLQVVEFICDKVAKMDSKFNKKIPTPFY